MPSVAPSPDINTLLPSELLFLIFKLLRHQDLKQAVAVCRRWRDVGEAASLWTWVCPRITVKNTDHAYDMLTCRRMQSVSDIRIAALSNEVVDGVACHPMLNSASVSCGQLSSQERRLLVKLTSKLENIVLSLAKDEVSYMLPEILFTSHSALKELNLSNNDLSKVPLDLIGQTASTLEDLQLQGTNLATGQLRRILESVSRTSCKLKKLNLGENDISGVEAKCFENLDRLEVVELENTQLSKSQLVTILSCLPGSARTRKLNLNQNRLSTIVPALLSRLAFLEEARLADCQLSPRQLEVVFEVTTKFGKLRKLDISGHCFKTIDISSLSLIQASEQLEELIAHRCQFSQESLEGIFSKIIGGPRLKKLNLSNALWVYP